MEQIHVSISNTNGLGKWLLQREKGKDHRKNEDSLSGRRMKAADAKTIQEIGIPSVVLMERAAMAVARRQRK